MKKFLLSAYLASPRKRSKEARGGQKERSQSTGYHMYLLTRDWMQCLLPYFQTTSSILTQEWNGAQIWTKEKDLLYALANFGIAASQAPSSQITYRPWSRGLASLILEFQLVPEVPVDSYNSRALETLPSWNFPSLIPCA